MKKIRISINGEFVETRWFPKSYDIGYIQRLLSKEYDESIEVTSQPPKKIRHPNNWT